MTKLQNIAAFKYTLPRHPAMVAAAPAQAGAVSVRPHRNRVRRIVYY